MAVAASAAGATPVIAALNASILPNRWGDTPDQHRLDTLAIGCSVNDEALVKRMCDDAHRCVRLIEGWGVEFARVDGDYHRRHASGSTYPRSLCRTSEIVGVQIYRELRKWLEDHGVELISNATCTDVLCDDNGVTGARLLVDGVPRVVSAPVVIAAWGGAGSLLPNSYPWDVDGEASPCWLVPASNCAIDSWVRADGHAFAAGARRTMPTAMLGEGAYLLNSRVSGSC